MKTTETIYETCAETAKKVRKALKAAFPGTRFSVRSKTYSGGSSIRVEWIDGPRKGAVQKVAGHFASATFDAMTDCKEYKSYEHEGQRYSGADFVFCGRDLSEARRAAILNALDVKYVPNHWGDYAPWQWDEAEKDL